MNYRILVYSLADVIEKDSMAEVNEVLIREEEIRKNICVVVSKDGEAEEALKKYRRSLIPKPKPTPPPSNYGNGK